MKREVLLLDAGPILQPVVALMLWTIVIWIYMYVRRLSFMSGAGIDPQSVAQGFGDPRKMPPEVANPPANLRNLVEIPVLFYATGLSLAIAGFESMDVRLAWAFVVLRVLHSLIHVSYNRVMHRFAVYVLGAAVLWVLVVRLAIKVF